MEATTPPSPVSVCPRTNLYSLGYSRMNPTSNLRSPQDESCSQSQSVRGGATETAITGIGERLANALEGICSELKRIADRLDPPPPDKVGTPYVADKLGCTTVWITDMIR